MQIERPPLKITQDEGVRRDSSMEALAVMNMATASATRHVSTTGGCCAAGEA